MVSASMSSSRGLTGDDYLCPLTEIWNVLLRSDAAETTSVEKVEELLRFHKSRIAAPWQAFSTPSTSSAALLKQPAFDLPHTNVRYTVEQPAGRLAQRLSDLVDIDQVSAFMLVRSYQVFGLEDETDEERIFDRVLGWYTEEVLAIPQIALAILRLAEEQTRLGDVAQRVRDLTIPEPAKYIEGLFRAFSGLAQSELPEKQKGTTSLFWATHQLRLQAALLDLLFVTLFQTPARPAAISEGLLRGAVMSSFGTSQANREVWETDPEATRVSLYIRDLMVLIALDALCLREIVAPVDLASELDGTLLNSPKVIQSVHQFIVDYSNDLAPHHPEPPIETVALPVWPMPIICLAWAIVLKSLREERRPEGGEGSASWEELAIRALRLPSGLFPWLEAVLSGPLLLDDQVVSTSSVILEVGLFQRKLLKDLIIGLSDLAQPGNIADTKGLYRCWELLFGGGSASIPSQLAADFWIADFGDNERSWILNQSHFPSQPVNLLRALSSLVGSSAMAGSQDAYGKDPAGETLHYFANLPTVTHAVDDTWVKLVERDAVGRGIVEAVRPIVLPGGGMIPKGSEGVIIAAEGSTTVMWVDQNFSGWPLLLNILQAAAGILPADHRATPSVTFPTDAVVLSVRDLDIRSENTADILSVGIKFLRATLQSSYYIKNLVLTQLDAADEPTSGQALLTLALTVLHHSRTTYTDINSAVVSDAIDIVQALITTPSSNVWPALRSSGFFDASGKKRGSVATLIQADSVRGEHALTSSVLRLVHTIVVNASHVPDSDAFLLRSALHLVFNDIWNNFSAWRYKDVAKKYELSSALVAIFDTVLAHPFTADGSAPTVGAQVLIDLFITSTSPLTYRPVMDAITQAGYLVPRLIGNRREVDAKLVSTCLDESLNFIATLTRIASLVGTPANALPKSLLVMPVAKNPTEKLQLVDSLFDLALSSTAQPSNILSAFKLIRVYLDTVAIDPHRPSLASMLRDSRKTFDGLAELTKRTDDPEVKAACWDVLATVVITQPGCVQACIGQAKDNTLDGALGHAIDVVVALEGGLAESPHTLAAVLNYLQAIIRAAGADKTISIIRKDTSFWQAVFNLSTRIVPAPPSSLSMRSADFATRIQRYAHSVQAKANATSLLACELAYALDNDDDDTVETEARTLVLSLFRNKSALQEATLMASHSSCRPELHEQQNKIIKAFGGHLPQLKTVFLPFERDYGISYLYDGNVVVPGSDFDQSSVNLALDMLNLNWSMLDADIAFTRSFRQLAETVNPWIEGDTLAVGAALAASVAVAECVAEEDRSGDVMLAIQVERLSILAVLLESALDDAEAQQPDAQLVRQLSISLAAVLTSQDFPPIVSLRHSELPAIHQPVLRALYLVLTTMSTNEITAANVSSRESLIDAGTCFALESADVVLDSIVRGKHSLPTLATDLNVVVGVLCELAKLGQDSGTTAWLDKVQGVNLIGRSLEVLIRIRVTNDRVPVYLSSILLLHLALASNPLSAEKLAVSGVLSAYSDNAIAVEAEHGRIASPPTPTHTTHDAWCGMLLVIKALLSTLPDTTSFTRTDVIPFIRVCNAQMLRAMSWDGETPVSASNLIELELVADVFYGIVNALGPGSLADYATPAMHLLKSVRFALSHPRMLSTLFVPSDEEERAGLEGELEVLEAAKDIDLFDVTRTPILASRTTALLRITRTVMLTLVALTRSWETIKMDVDPDSAERWIIQPNEETIGNPSSSDPVGVINDIYLIVSGIQDRLPAAPSTAISTISDGGSQELRKMTLQILESASLLSFTQLLLRQSLLPPDERSRDEGSMDLDIAASGKRRSSSGGSREGMVLRELEGDFRGMISGETGEGMRNVLRGLAEKAFGSDS
ncbi:hypothetical protein IAU60_006031 [Kwoniella sp. DSM 27419]